MIDEDLRALARDGLVAKPRRLPFALLYDDLGSALFHAITLLPEYGLTRADHRLLARHAGEIVASLAGPIEMAEMGPGSGSKASVLVSAARAAQHRVRFFGIDVSSAALEACARTLEASPGVEVVPVQSRYLQGLSDVQERRSGTAPLLVLFLGSNIGNLEREEAGSFLRRVRAVLRPGDGLLVSADLVKPGPVLEAAYDDPLGVTAAFNLNVLARLNRELDGTFDVRGFRHRARYDEEHRRVEMHLEAVQAQRVLIPGLGLDLAIECGDRIWTESSHKFDADEIARLGRDAGFTASRQWIDEEWPFALTLLG